VVKRGSELHEAAALLHEEHARHAREGGDELTAKRAEERAQRAKKRAEVSREREVLGRTAPDHERTA